MMTRTFLHDTLDLPGNTFSVLAINSSLCRPKRFSTFPVSLWGGHYLFPNGFAYNLGTVTLSLFIC